MVTGKWTCKRCLSNPDLKEARGSCGGPFKASLFKSFPLQIFQTPEGSWTYEGATVRNGKVVLYDMTVFKKDLGFEFESCPLAELESPGLEMAWRGHRWMDRGSLALIEEHPSCGLIDAIDTLSCAIAEEQQCVLDQSMGKKPDGQ